MDTKITEEFVVERIINYMINKENGNWHSEKVVKSDLHKHGVDIKLVGGKRNSEYFFVECKGKSYAKSANSINKECWLNALGQIIQRMEHLNAAYKYGLGLYWVTAQVALRRIPKETAQKLHLHVFAVNDEGNVKYFTPSKFGVKYSDEKFM